MRTRRGLNCLRWIALLVALWVVAVLAVEPNHRVSPYSVWQTEEEESSSSSSSQMQIQQGTPWPQAMIAEANEALRNQIALTMEQVGFSFDLTLNTRDLVYVCRDDIIIVNAGAAGFENAESPAGVLRVDVGLIYLSRETQVRFGDGKLGTRLPTGFYAVRATINRSSAVHDPGITILELFDSAGGKILEFPVTALAALDERRLTASLSVGAAEAGFSELSSAGGQREGVACLGWYGTQFSCELCVVFNRDE